MVLYWGARGRVHPAANRMKPSTHGLLRFCARQARWPRIATRGPPSVSQAPEHLKHHVRNISMNFQRDITEYNYHIRY